MGQHLVMSAPPDADEHKQAKGVGLRIRWAREAKGWTQQELANEVGYGSGSTISHIERGWDNASPRLLALTRIAEALGVPLASLLEPVPMGAGGEPQQTEPGQQPLPAPETGDAAALLGLVEDELERLRADMADERQETRNALEDLETRVRSLEQAGRLTDSDAVTRALAKAVLNGREG